MLKSKYFSSLVMTVITVCALLLSGCSSSSDSDSEPEPDPPDSDPPVSFTSGTISPGDTYSYTFEEEGEVEYYCEIHAPDMQGVITVTSSAEAVESDTVSMENDQFVPENLSVAPNTEVVWVNNQSHAHDIRSGNPSSGGNGGGNPDY